MPASSSVEQLDILSIQSGVMVGAVGNDAAGPIYAPKGTERSPA
jgi:pyridoxal/pyridoxine/pyridoxamine kinase